MNALLTRPVLERTMSAHASAAQSDVAKTVFGRHPTGSFALCRPNLPCRANAASRWMHPEIHQSGRYFPDLVATSGERIFNAYWR